MIISLNECYEWCEWCNHWQARCRPCGSYYKLYDVGDGLSLARFSEEERMLIDCGSQQGWDLPFYVGFKQTVPRTFVLSHFHLDHYNGIYHPEADGVSCIRRFIFPALPIFGNGDAIECEGQRGWQISQELARSIFSMNAYLLRKCDMPGAISGSMDVDIIERLSRISRCRVNVRKVSQGDWMGAMHVLWPPKKIVGTLRSVCRAINAFREVRKKYPEMNEIYERLDGVGRFLSVDESGDDSYGKIEENEENSEEEIMKKRRRRMRGGGECEVPEDVWNANLLLRGVANRLSLSFWDVERSVLFLGDLESSEIEQVLNYVKKQNYFLGRARFLITAHHGTHKSASLQDLDVVYALSSVGPKLHRNLKSIYDEISWVHRNTWEDGTLCFS